MSELKEQIRADLKAAMKAKEKERTGTIRMLLAAIQTAETEASILEEYQPKQLTDEELSALVDAVVNDLGATSMAQMGAVMKEATAKAAGRADGKRLSQAVKARLS